MTVASWSSAMGVFEESREGVTVLARCLSLSLCSGEFKFSRSCAPVAFGGTPGSILRKEVPLRVELTPVSGTVVDPLAPSVLGVCEVEADRKRRGPTVSSRMVMSASVRLSERDDMCEERDGDKEETIKETIVQLVALAAGLITCWRGDLWRIVTTAKLRNVGLLGPTGRLRQTLIPKYGLLLSILSSASKTGSKYKREVNNTRIICLLLKKR